MGENSHLIPPMQVERDDAGERMSHQKAVDPRDFVFLTGFGNVDEAEPNGDGETQRKQNGFHFDSPLNLFGESSGRL